MLKLYDQIKYLLLQHPELRDSDKKLQWYIWGTQGFIVNGNLSYEAFLNSRLISSETIRRTRQKIQETFPDLRSSHYVQLAKDKKRRTKSTFVYKEPMRYRYEGNNAIPIR